MTESSKRPADQSRTDASRIARPARRVAETVRAADSVPLATGPFATLPVQFGRYRIEKLLGQGAMGAVYLADDIQLERRVALKVARVSASGSAKLIRRMETEAKAAATIDHPRICKVFDFGEIDGIRFIALQHIEGEDIKSNSKRLGRRREPAEAVRLIQQMAEAVQAAHDKGVIHRDLKPENVMLTPGGEPVIMDFGLARRMMASTDAGLTQGMIVGTAAYMSPEQAVGKAEGIDHRSDLYALGVMLFEMLTGEWPFAGTAIEVMGKKCIQDPPSPLDLDPTLPLELAAACSRMIARQKEDRYASCRDAITALSTVDLNVAESIEGVERPAWLKKSSKSIEVAASPEVGSEVVPKWWQQSVVRRCAWGGVGVFCLALALVPFQRQPNPTSVAAIVPVSAPIVPPPDGQLLPEPEPTEPSEPVNKIDRTQFRVVAGQWRVEANELLQTDTNESFPILIFGDPSWTDYEFSVDMMRVEGRDQGAVGFRVSSAGFYMFGIGTTRSGNQCSTELHEGQQWFTIANSFHQTYNHVWYTVRVRVEGNTVQCFLKDGDDESLVSEFTDDRLSSGRVALRVFKSAFRFRNLKVISLDGNTLWEGMPELP
ncbi:MAG: protein kinase [Planctomycetes bacterium]|nr:protein kinase [Planctomycetota bacterium]